MGGWLSLRVIAKSIALIARAPGWLLQCNLKRRKAKKTFEKELLEAGLSSSEARDLRELYPFNIEDMLSSARPLR
jgi:hypothetical protein